MNNKKNIIFIVSFALFLTCSLQAAKPKQFFLPGIRPLGMGGAFLALSDDQNAMFYNPAGITQRLKPLLCFADTTLQTNQTGYELGSYIIDLYLNGTAGLDPAELLAYFTDQLEANNYYMRYNIYALSPLNLSLIAPPMGYLSVGLGAYVSAINADFEMQLTGLLPDVGLSASADSGIIIPIAYDLGEKFSIGVNIKGINRNNIDVDMSLQDLLDMDLPQAMVGFGYGFDTGILMHLGEQLSLGATVKDIGFTKINYTKAIELDPASPGGYNITDLPATVVERIEPTLNVGFAYLFTNEQLPMGDNILLVFQYDDLTGRMEEVGHGEIVFRPKNIHLGIELSYEIVSFRVGLNQGYGTLGLGVYLGPISVDYAFYGQELGLNAGDIAQWNHIVSLAVRLR